MKTYFLINSLESGGAERVLSTLCNNLNSKIDLELLTLKDNTFYKLNNKVKKTALLKVKNNLLMFFAMPVYYLKLKSLSRIEKSSQFVSFLEISNFLNILVNREKAIISFRTNIDLFKEKGLLNFIYLLLIKNFYKRAGLIIVNSEENRYKLSSELKISLDNIITIYNPLEIDNKNNNSNLINDINLENKKIFINVGRLDKNKNHINLICAFKSILKYDKNLVLLIIGDGCQKNKLKIFIDTNNLNENILLLGRKKNVNDYLKIAHYFIFSSKVEGFPNVLIEAMAHDLPIITTDFKTGAREIIDPTLTFDEIIKYPYFGPNGVLLSQSNFEGELLEVYKNLNKLQQKKSGFSKFEISAIINNWESVINS